MVLGMVLTVTHRTIVEPSLLQSARGQYDWVYFGEGVLIDEARGPEFAACRGWLRVACLPAKG
jgi:hypothetical protein